MSKYYLYIHTCPNGKKYIGTTRNEPKIRWESGFGYKSNKHFVSAIQLYGWNNIIHEVIECDSSKDMWYGEKYLIAYYNTTNPEYGYNLSKGGEGSSYGCRFSLSEEAKKKMSEAKKGSKNPNFGKHSWNFGKHTPYYGGGQPKGNKIPKYKWLTPEGNVVEMGIGQAHRFHSNWIKIN